ncbi:hypothetical protein [Caulobacter sp. DWR2-3-1b2]|uniref:hypothetical protein n=1 Tax=unclassified Caulobacter TaxID=2648921 RepID=UPI003CFB3512
MMTATNNQHLPQIDRHVGTQGPRPSGLSIRWQTVAQILCAGYIAAHYIALLVQTSYKSTLLDELTALAILPLALMFAVSRPGRIPGLLFLVYLIVLILGGYLSQYGGVPQPRAALVAAVLDAKIAIFTFALAFLIARSPEPEKIIRVAVYTLAVFAVINLPFVFLDLARGSDIYGAHLTIKGGFPQPRALLHHHTEAAWLYCLAGLGAFTLFQERRQQLFLWLALAFGATLLITLSVKEIAAFLIGVVIIAGSAHGGRLGKAVLALCIVGGAAVVLYSTNIGDAILGHAGMFVGESAIPTVRGAMTEVAPAIANENFPLGSGGGTFGSAPSYQYGYSDVYYRYNIYKLYGGSPEYSNFLQDVFWPKIIGEAGWIGFAAYVTFMAVLVRRLNSPKFSHNSSTVYYRRLSLSIVVAILIISSASAPFTNELLLFAAALGFGYSARTFIARKRRIRHLDNQQERTD